VTERKGSPVSERLNELPPAADGVRRGGGRSAGLRLRGSRNLRLPALLAALLLALGVLVVPVAASAAPGET
jgi:hypothetical protein